MSSAKSIASNFTIQLAGKILSVMIGLVSVAIITRSLGTHAFGEYTTITTYLQLFGVVVDFGLTLTLIVMISKPNVDEERIVGNFFGLRLLSGFLLFSIAPLIVLALPWSQTVMLGVIVGAFAYFLMGAASMLLGIFQRHESMWRASLAELINRGVLLALIIFFAAVSPGVVEMIAAMVFANAIWLMLMIAFAKPFVRIRPLFEWSQWIQILKQSWPIALSIVFNLLYLKGDILFLAYFRDQNEVGLYGVAYRIIDVLTVLPTMLMGLMLPSLVHLWNSGQKEAFRARVSQLFDIFALTVIPLIVGTQVVATELIHLIAGDAFISAGLILQWLVLALFGVFLGALYGHLVVALDKQRIMTLGYVFVAIVSIVGYLLFIPTYGVWGAIGVTLLSEALIATLTFLVVYKTSKALPHLRVLAKSLIAAGVMYLTIVGLNTHVLIDVSVGAAIYIALLLALKAIDVNQIKSLITSK